ncbi:response regulator [Aquimarina brevivitae]|uniref:Two-component system cell cycle response regulator DivK n=1 Tax=Aquimarina brevivitae TaxID=323412 RepID=A0A4Q7NTI5_9FLAO|nr:response regulator [Aquimarina brevivitae]RZS90461.1 two-component system cell cycle response regulator DivK [Aquimarina brevivitae]
MNILYVEDNRINAIVMEKMLTGIGTDVAIAETPLKALKIANEKPLDLILVDINLGLNQMDGCELLQRFKKMDLLQNIPIFAVTAYAMPGDEQRFLNLGFDDYFSKPVNFDRLIRTIENIRTKLV